MKRTYTEMEEAALEFFRTVNIPSPRTPSPKEKKGNPTPPGAPIKKARMDVLRLKSKENYIRFVRGKEEGSKITMVVFHGSEGSFKNDWFVHQRYLNFKEELAIGEKMVTMFREETEDIDEILIDLDYSDPTVRLIRINLE